MKRLSHLLFVALLLVVTGAVPGLTADTLSRVDVDGGIIIAGPVPIASTCGYSASGVDNAKADCENNAANYCINRGSTGATITTWHDSWVDDQGYAHICCTFACN
jgi:hypothetical protein